MSNKPYDDKQVDKRVSLGDDARTSRRRSGAALARPGNFMALNLRISADEPESSQKTSRRSVRLKIKPLQESNSKD
jgi:hypothetical protein